MSDWTSPLIGPSGPALRPIASRLTRGQRPSRSSPTALGHAARRDIVPSGSEKPVNAWAPFRVAARLRQVASSSSTRGDHEAPLGLLALAVRLHVPAIAQVFVDDPPLGRRASGRARPAPRCAAPPRRRRRRRRAAPRRGARGNRRRRSRPARSGWALGKDDPLREMLDGVDRLAVAADEQTDVIAVEAARSARRRSPRPRPPRRARGRRRSPRAALSSTSAGSSSSSGRGAGSLGLAHRRLPERFFFLRGRRAVERCPSDRRPRARAPPSAHLRAPSALPLGDARHSARTPRGSLAGAPARAVAPCASDRSTAGRSSTGSW